MIVIPVLIFDKNSRSFVADMWAPWQHCPLGHRVLIGKSMQLEKTDTAMGKRNLQKHLAHRQAPSQLWRTLSNETPQYTHKLNFAYEDDIKIRNKYFATV
jgi:hypothetical protein